MGSGREARVRHNRDNTPHKAISSTSTLAYQHSVGGLQRSRRAQTPCVCLRAGAMVRAGMERGDENDKDRREGDCRPRHPQKTSRDCRPPHQKWGVGVNEKRRGRYARITFERRWEEETSKQTRDEELSGRILLCFTKGRERREMDPLHL
jgi:hypothetical protein